MIGQTVSHYRVLGKIGEGGMGEVYLAEDTSLKRKVALKFLPYYLQQDEVAQKRFLREAQSAAALDHPFICKIFETGDADGQSFIAMEHVRGQTLKEKLLGGPVPLKQTLQIGMEIAEALEEAHKAGIAHRDLKPANIMLTSGGHVKVMDFGLAKRLSQEDGTEQDITAGLTREGTTLGTPAYMSPEQLRGKTVDTRTDIFSFGIVLYELLSGVHPFRRPKQAETIGAILHEEPEPLSLFSEDSSEILQHTISKMLAKDPDERYQSVHEVRTNLHGLLSKLSTADAVPRPGKKKTPFADTRRLAYWALGLAAIAVLTVTLVNFLTPPGIPSATNPVQITSDGRPKFIYGVSTDGRSVYYSQTDDPVFPRQGFIHQVSVTGGEAVPIDPWSQEEGLTLLLDVSPDFSRLLACRSTSDRMPYYSEGMPVWILSLPAGTPKRLGEILANNARWSPDGERIAYSTGNELYVCRRDGNGSRKLLTVENAMNKPGSADSEDQPVQCYTYSWSPDGQRICYGVFNWEEDTCELWEVSLDGAAQHQFFADREDLRFAIRGRWTADGEWLLFANETRGGTRTSLWALSSHEGWFDRRPEEPIQLTSGSQNYTTLTLSPDGKKIFGLGWELRAELVRYRQEINEWVPYDFPPTASPAFVNYSPDGEWLAYVDYPDCTLWVSRVDGTQKQQLTELGLWVHSLSWSPDGERIAFTGAKSGVGLENRVYWVQKEGPPVHKATKEDYYQQNASWSPKGKLLVSGDGKEAPALRLIDLETGGVEELPESEGMWECAWSPDGRYIASHAPRSDSIVLFDRERQEWSPLAGCEGGVLTWSADSFYLHFYGKDQRIYRVHIEGRTVQEVADLSKVAKRTLLASLGTNQWWYGFDPEGSLITLRALGTTEIYALDFEAP